MIVIYGWIYVLIDPRTGLIRYVGQTTLALADRLRLHLSAQKMAKRSKLSDWLRELRRFEMAPAMLPIMIGRDQDHLDALEIGCVNQMLSQGADLVNTHGGGTAVHAPNIDQTNGPAPVTLGRRLMESRPVAQPSAIAAPVPRKRRIAEVRELLRLGTSLAEILDWCGATFEKRPDAPAKTWRVSRPEAYRLIHEAQTENALGDQQSSAVKKAERRAVYELLLQRSLSRNTLAADLLATKINDAMCRLDNVYEATMAPTNAIPLNVEDAVEAIEHANNTLALARSRGVVSTLPAGRMIDAEAEELEDEPDESEDDESAGKSAN